MTTTLTVEQYLALSAISGINLASDVDSLIGVIREQEYQGIDFGDRQFIALSTLDGWKLLDVYNTTTGFAGAAFQAPDGPNGEPGEIVFAFRGTEFTPVDYATDANIVIPNSSTSGPNQFNDAFHFWTDTISTYDNSGYSFTGHSLGGGIAQYMTYMTNEVGHSVTFNAVGIGQVLSFVKNLLFRQLSLNILKA